MSGKLGNAATPAVLVAVSLVAAAAFVMGATSLTGRSQGGEKLTGTYTVTQQGAFAANQDCSVEGAADGSPVAVRNEAGEVIRLGRLVGGLGVKAAGDTTKASQCRFTFVVTKVPNAESYAVRVGAREPQTFTKAELHAANWTVALTSAA